MDRARLPGRRPLRRWLTLPATVALVLQIAAATAAPVVDGFLSSGDPVAHVEAPGNESCPTAHNHFACQICRTITAPAVAVAAPRVPLRDSPVLVPSAAAPLGHVQVGQPALGPRGPPPV